MPVPGYPAEAGGAGRLGRLAREGGDGLANLVTYSALPDIAPIRMGDGLTSAFICVPSLAASVPARSDRQRELAACSAAHDQSVFGNGVAGFDIGGPPRSPGTFDGDPNSSCG